MSSQREIIIKAVQTTFPSGNIDAILDLLDHYGVEPYEREKERVQLAIIRLSLGDEKRLLSFIEMAKQDYRDVLQDPVSDPEGLLLQQAVQEMLKKWGKDSSK